MHGSVQQVLSFIRSPTPILHWDALIRYHCSSGQRRWDQLCYGTKEAVCISSKDTRISKLSDIRNGLASSSKVLPNKNSIE